MTPFHLFISVALALSVSTTMLLWRNARPLPINGAYFHAAMASTALTIVAAAMSYLFLTSTLLSLEDVQRLRMLYLGVLTAPSLWWLWAYYRGHLD